MTVRTWRRSRSTLVRVYIRTYRIRIQGRSRLPRARAGGLLILRSRRRCCAWGRHQAGLSRAIDRLASVVTDYFKSHSHFLQRAALVHNTCQLSVRRKHHRNPHIKRYATFAIGVFSPRFCDCRRCLLCTPSSPLTTLASSSSTCKVICFTRTLT